MAKCKFCGKGLKTGYEDNYYPYYYCDCEGQEKATKIKDEISQLEKKIKEKRDALNALLDEGAYGKLIKQQKSVEEKLNGFEDAMFNC